MNELTPNEITEALDGCAQEAVHIPGNIQPFGALLAFSLETKQIAYASENIAEALGKGSLSEVLGAPLDQVLPRETLHQINNSNLSETGPARREPVGQITTHAGTYDLHTFASGAFGVLEIEPASLEIVPSTLVIRELLQLQEKLRNDTDELPLLQSAVRLLRSATGYDRVMAYRFDSDFNGEVVAESRKGNMEPFLGLHFPHWDIPAQARAIMAKLPLRFIGDVDQDTVPIQALASGSPPLDITFANLRGVSRVHMQYLRNMGVRGTMTLSVMINNRLWGMFSFHHRRPRVPSAQSRQLVLAFLPFVNRSLALALSKSEVDLAARVRELRHGLAQKLRSDSSLTAAFADLSAELQAAFDADGVSFKTSEERVHAGDVPSQASERALLEKIGPRLDAVATSNCMRADFEVAPEQANGLAGCIVIRLPSEQTLVLYRREISHQVNWAGVPEKQIETVDGINRLAPRGSFAVFKESVRGRCRPWSPINVELAQQVHSIMIAADSQAVVEKLARHQSLMIDELNHRVRNIVALIRSVSRQARKHHSSLDSYQRALEARISALAAAHDVGTGNARSAVSIRQLVAVEARPYDQDQTRVRFHGEDRYLRSDQGPLFALVVHELITNCVKYGALASENGHVDLNVRDHEDGLEFEWREIGGPAVTPPPERGFGAALIEGAVPHELGGKADVRYVSTGLEVDFWLPRNVLVEPVGDEMVSGQTIFTADFTLPTSLTHGLLLLLEDNFVIATETEELLRELGCNNVEVASSAEDAEEIIEDDTPVAAVLDVNLGAGRGNSFKIASQLNGMGTPIIFVTGYGSRIDAPDEFKNVPVLNKPVDTSELCAALRSIMR